MPSTSNHRRSITGIYEFDRMAVRFSATRDDRTKFWTVIVTDNAGRPTMTDFVFDAELWTEICRVVGAAEEESRAGAKELAEAE